MKIILGINCFHADSSACLLIDGQLIGAIAEERLGPRIKHDSSFPINSINYLLSSNNLNLADVDIIALPRNTKSNLIAKFFYVLKNPLSSWGAVNEHFYRTFNSKKEIDQFGLFFKKKLKFKIYNIEHHLAHIASSYYLSPYDKETTAISYDSSGDFVSMMIAKCEGNNIKINKRVFLPDSLGFFYTSICQYIGFKNFGEEYKVMGLAAYGEDNFSKEMNELVQFNHKNFYRLNRKFFNMHNGGRSGLLDNENNLVMRELYEKELFSKLFNSNPIEKLKEISKREMDLAKSAQIKFEEVALESSKEAYKFNPFSKNLLLSGGCALNGLANTKIYNESKFENVFLQPASSDDGTSIGAAYYVWNNILKKKERYEIQHAFFGPKYEDDYVYNFLKNNKYFYKKCDDNKHLTIEVAKIIAENHVIGWHQGRSEIGARALGNRSILANPGDPDMKNKINLKIKKRESFRPFAPSVLEEDSKRYFENIDSPFMTFVVKIKKEYLNKFPAITHVDGTSRLQTVTRDSNNLYYNLISEFKKITGYGMILNTSFNENEPIIDSPEQALSCFERTNLDYLVINKCILKKTSLVK